VAKLDALSIALRDARIAAFKRSIPEDLRDKIHVTKSGNLQIKTQCDKKKSTKN
jgi:hypothetical protein